MKFRKKPVVIEAYQFKPGMDTHGVVQTDHIDGYFIDTLEGIMRVEKDDWIIKGVEGEFYPCKPDIFELTYTKNE